MMLKLRRLVSSALRCLALLVRPNECGELKLDNGGKYSLSNLHRVVAHIRNSAPSYLTADSDPARCMLSFMDFSEAKHIRRLAMHVLGYDEFMILGVRGKLPSGVRYCDVVGSMNIYIVPSPPNERERRVYPFRVIISSDSLNYPIEVRLTVNKFKKLFRVLVVRGRVDFYGYLLGTLAGKTLLRTDYMDYVSDNNEIRELVIFNRYINELHLEGGGK